MSWVGDQAAVVVPRGILTVRPRRSSRAGGGAALRIGAGRDRHASSDPGAARPAAHLEPAAERLHPIAHVLQAGAPSALGLYRARVGARWAALCLVAGPVLDAVLSGILGSSDTGELVVGVVSDGVFLAGAAGLAWWLLTTSNAAWEGVAAALASPERGTADQQERPTARMR